MKFDALVMLKKIIALISLNCGINSMQISVLNILTDMIYDSVMNFCKTLAFAINDSSNLYMPSIFTEVLRTFYLEPYDLSYFIKTKIYQYPERIKNAKKKLEQKMDKLLKVSCYNYIKYI